MSARPAILGFASITDLPVQNKSLDVNTLLIPINNPPATIAGMIGTKISLNILTKRWIGFPFAFFTVSEESSSLLTLLPL